MKSEAFRFEVLDGQIGILTLDAPEQKVNTLGRAVVAELGARIAEIESRGELRGLLLRSGKPDQFIAGADLKELEGLVYATREEIRQRSEAGYELCDRISRLPFPTVALIDGACLGGGTELTLLMDYRIASDSDQTTIGFPEVKVGIIPGLGGTQRLPRIIGVHHAVQMICSGDPIPGDRAAELGLVFDTVPAERLVEEGCRLIERAVETGEWRTIRERMEQPLGLTEDQMAFAFGVAEGHIRALTAGHYPAPLSALREIRDGVNLPLADGLELEQRAFREVVGSRISANMIGVFFASRRLAADSGVDDPEIQPRPVSKVGVLGAGQMGSGIATAHARSGFLTTMVDVDVERITNGMRMAQNVVAGRIKAGRATQGQMNRMLSMLNTSTSQQVFAGCDVVVEAVTENEELKTGLYGQLADVLAPDAILASNTSTISITRMAKAWPDPDKFVGMHFFYPVDRMSLVEVVRGDQTSDETVATIVALAKRIRKTPIVVRDCPGFLVNRILMPYMNEALVLLTEGASMDAIDKAATRWGMPMGPIALHDFVGLDTCSFAGGVMREGYEDRTVKTPILDALVAAGRLGRKSGAGFRAFFKGKPRYDPAVEPLLAEHRASQRDIGEEEIQERLFLSMLIEATRALEEGIVRTPVDLDMGLILGIGFPRFRGGILRWCDTEGAAFTLDRIARYSALGKRFEPTESLLDMARSDRLFYPRPRVGV